MDQFAKETLPISLEEEMRIIKGTTGTAVARATPALEAAEVVNLQAYVRGVPIADSVVNYAARRVAATRPGSGGPAELHKYIAYGASPRASQCLVLGAMPDEKEVILLRPDLLAANGTRIG